MPRFAANLTTLFNEEAFLDRFGAAAKAGFQAVEFLFPYAFEAGDIRSRLDEHALDGVLVRPTSVAASQILDPAQRGALRALPSS